MAIKRTLEQIDTISIINDKKYCIVNTNDSPFDLACETLGEINKQYQKIDLLLTGYSGAGAIFQCLSRLSAEKKISEGNKKIYFLDQAYYYIKKIKTRLIIYYLLALIPYQRNFGI